jgi:glutathione S-transferase
MSSHDNKFVLTYFPTRGRGETIRLLLEDQRLPYTNRHVQREEWGNLKQQLRSSPELRKRGPFGQLPMFEDETSGLNIVQSQAILRYLARRFNLYGKNEQEMIRCDIVEEALVDGNAELRQIAFDPNFDSRKDKFLADELSTRLNDLEFFFTLNPSKSDTYWVGNDVTFVDYFAWDYLDKVRTLSKEVLSKHPHLHQFWKSFPEVRPNLAQYLRSHRRANLVYPPNANFGNTPESS